MRRTPAVLVLAALAAACERKDEIVLETGTKVGETVTSLAKGVGAGIEAASAIPVEVSDAVAARGMSATRSTHEDGVTSVYVVARYASSLTLVVKALNRDGAEIGRARADVEFGADDGRYVALSFPPELDRKLVAKYLVDEAR